MKLRKERWRNKGLWIAIASLILLVLQDLGLNITPEHYQQYVTLILSITIMAGIINDPNLGEWYDDKEGTNDK